MDSVAPPCEEEAPFASTLSSCSVFSASFTPSTSSASPIAPLSDSSASPALPTSDPSSPGPSAKKCGCFDAEDESHLPRLGSVSDDGLRPDASDKREMIDSPADEYYPTAVCKDWRPSARCRHSVQAGATMSFFLLLCGGPGGLGILYLDCSPS